MKKFLSVVLSVLMLASCMSFVAFADGSDEDANLAAVEPLEFKFSDVGTAQGCAGGKKDTTDTFGRAVQQIIPGDASNTNGIAPATFFRENNYPAARNSAYRVVKFVYYTESQANPGPLSAWAYDATQSGNMARRNAVPLVSADSVTANGGGWSVAYYNLNTSNFNFDAGEYLYAYMFPIFQGDKPAQHMGETIYLGYAGLFDTLENAKAHKSIFEGDIVISGIKVNGTAIEGFDAATTSYTVDLAGAYKSPEVTLVATGNTNGVEINVSEYNATAGTASAEISAGDKTYSISFTGGATATGRSKELKIEWDDDAQGLVTNGMATLTDEFGRSYKNFTPSTTSTSRVAPGGSAGDSAKQYGAFKLVYRTSGDVPQLRQYYAAGGSAYTNYVKLENPHVPNEWNTAYYELDGLSMYQVSYAAPRVQGTYDLAYIGMFGNMIDAYNHETIFEGDLNITDVKIGGTSVGDVTEYTYDLAGADTIPALTITATGNTNNVVITNGTLANDGTAVSTVKNGDDTVVTVSFTGGYTYVEPVATVTDWHTASAQRCTSEGEKTDEFGRKSRTYHAENQYYDGGDKTATGQVAPGGAVPAAGQTADYKVFKLVYKSDITTVPKLSAFPMSGGSKHIACTSGATSLEAGKWHTLYFDYASVIGIMKMYMIIFTADDVANHIGEDYTIGYSGVFGSLEDAMAHKSAFEGDFTITDVLLDGTSIGNVTSYNCDLDGGAAVPVLTIKATGDTNGVAVTNGVMDKDGNATSKVTVNGEDVVVVNFTGGSLDFTVTDILYDGKSIGNFNKNTAEYTVRLPYASKAPAVTYTYDGAETEATVSVTTANGDHKAEISYNGAVKYTVNFDVDDEKPTALINTLYKIQAGEQVTVGYFGGSVTGGTGSDAPEKNSWRGLSRDWLKNTFASVNTNIIERKASIGGTGSIYGIYRADRHLIKDKAPDLCFIEMAVNDSYDGGVYGTNDNYIYAESIVKKIYASNPKADIVFILTGDNSKLKAEVTSDTPQFGYVYTQLGEYYNIPCLYLGRELAKKIYAENGNKYPSSSDNIWMKYFNDIVHPTDLGYAFYGDVINEYLYYNLPTGYVPTASEYTDKVLPEKSYCELNGKGRLIVDAYTVAGNELKDENGNILKNDAPELGGYYSVSNGDYSPLLSETAGQVISLKFKAADIGAWAWAYNTGDVGTDITYSIDGGEVQTRNFYLSRANHRWHYFARNLDPEKEHVLRIYHKDSNKLDIRYFFLSGLSENITEKEMGVTAVPLADLSAKDKDGNFLFNVKVKMPDGTYYKDITFLPAKSRYAVIFEDNATLSAESTFPTIEVTVPEGYYGYEVTQATAENKVATFSVDNVKTFEFAFLTAEEAENYDDTELITKLDTPAKKMWSIVEGNTVNAPEAVASATNIDGLTIKPTWVGADGFEFGTKAVGNELIAYNAVYTAPAGFKFAASVSDGIENSEVSADGKTFTMKLYTYVIPKDAIYIDDGGSNSTDDYAEGNVQKPYKTIDYAMQLLEGKGGGVIVIVDKVTETNSGKPAESLKRSGDFIIMGWDEESVLEQTRHYNLRANTTIRDINLVMSQQHGGIYLNGYALTLGDKNYTDLIVTETITSARQILMASDGGVYGETGKLTINSGAFSLVIGSGYGITTITGDVDIEINGGQIDSLIAGLHCGNAAGVHSTTGDINLTINGGTIGTLNLGSSAAGYLHNGNLNAEINGGTINKIIYKTGNADKELNGAKYPQQLGDYTLKINGGTITGSISDASNGTTGVLGYTMIDLLDYEGDREAILAKINKTQFDEIRYQVVYVDATKGASANDGLTKDTAVATLTDAFAKFAGGLAGKIVLVGEVPTHKYDDAQSKYTDSLATDTAGRGHVEITGYDENAAFVFCKGTTFAGDTTFKNIHIVNNGLYANIFAGGHTLTFGKGITSTKTVSHHLQIGNGNSGANVSGGNIIIYSGTYGLIYSGADFNGGCVNGDTNITIYGGTFEGDIYAGGYVAASKLASVAGKDNMSGKISGKAGLYIHGGTFKGTIYLGGNQYGTVGALEAKISGGTFSKNINIGPKNASGTSGDVAYTTDILGNVIVEITGGTFTGKISHTENVIKGKAVVVASNGTAVQFINPDKFTYAVTASEKGTTTYDVASDKFSLVPVNSTMDIFVNENKITKASDNMYTLSGASNNRYDIKYGGETAISAKFIITPPMAELTPITEVIKTGGKNTYNDIGNCTVSNITWTPAHSRFEFDTEYTAKVTLTALNGIEFSDNLSGIVINGNYAENVVNAVLSEDKTKVEVTVKFPKTEKSDFAKLEATKTNVEVLFETVREGEKAEFYRDTTVTLTNLNDDTLSVSGKATETGTSGVFAAEVTSGIYNVTVKKGGYIKATVEGVMINSDETFTIDVGALIPGDVIGENGNTDGDGIVDIDDFLIALKGFAPDVKDEVIRAADINETGVINVTQLGHIKSGFGDDIDDATEYGGYFENTFYKLTVDKKLTVGYIGGSIIQGAGVETAGNEKYTDRMHKWFEDNFPEAEIHTINAGISNTGSNFANFRLEEDLMLRDEGYVPDLVFLEFCVNDFNTYGQDHIEMLYESLVKNVYEINPNADIVCLLTALSGYATSKAAHIKVANHYDIPVIDLGTPMSANYTIAGDCKIFTNDQLHPNGMGYELYAKLTKNLLEKYIIYGAPTNPKYTEKVLPEALQAQLLTNAKEISVADASVIKTGSWTTGTISTGSRIFNENKNATYISSNKAGDTFEFTFNGDAFGFLVRKSAAMGTFEFSVDGGEWIECNAGTSQATYTHCQTYMPGTVTADCTIPAGEHKVVVRVTGKKCVETCTDCEVSIIGIFYNASPAAE